MGPALFRASVAVGLQALQVGTTSRGLVEGFLVTPFFRGLFFVSESALQPFLVSAEGPKSVGAEWFQDHLGL